MRSQLIRLHPDSYKKLSTPLIFFISKVNTEQFQTIMTALRNQKSVLAISGKKLSGGEWRYNLLHRSFCLSFLMPGDHYNFASTYYDEDERAKRRFDNPHTKMFYIEPAGGVYLIYNNTLYSVSTGDPVRDVQWDMDRTEFLGLVRQMNAYFEDEEGYGRDGRKTYGRRFEANVLNPFKNFTAKERFVEESKVGENSGLTYFKKSYLKSNDKGSAYAFYSNDPNADPEKAFFSVGNKITLFNSDGTPAQTGILYDIDAESGEYVIFSIDFFFQTNDSEIPESGKMVIAYNDTQDKVREGVIKSMELSRIPSGYMYKTFSDFSVEGYNEPGEDLAQFLSEKLKDKYPPNQMQMEAIIKGLLTKDLLLVLGPPGTGKTTVIGTWVEYFIRQGKRVLISSQNNAAVDNVLERFKGSGEIVRLGQEAKVQENCREFIPSNKLRTMRSKCEENNARITAEVTCDLEAIDKYKAVLTRYGELIAEYKARRQVWDSDCRETLRHTREIRRIYGETEDVLHQIDVLLEDRARKIIFLEESRKKNFLIRLFIRRHMKHAEEELAMSADTLAKLQDSYRMAVKMYNAASSRMQVWADELRRKGSYTAFLNAKNLVLEFTEQNVVRVNSDGAAETFCCPELRSELRSFSDPVSFSIVPWENESLITSELLKMESVEQSARELKAAIDDWKNSVDSGRNDIFEEILLTSCQIVGATCIGINSAKKFAHVDFDVAIVDESGQIQIHNALVPMSRAPVTLMLGDYKQIPPCANDEVIKACENEGIKTDLLKMSFFEYLFESMRKAEIDDLMHEEGISYEEAKAAILKPVLDYYDPAKGKTISLSEINRMIADVTASGKKLVNLNSQFRMPGQISDIISEWFYENNYFSSYDMANYKPIVPGTDKPAVIVRTSNRHRRFEARPANNMGYYNDYEAELVADIVEKVIQSQPEETRWEFCSKISEKIGIISAYSAQVRTIREHLKRRGLDIDESQIRGMVASLDSFQGQERPLIIYSLTRSKASSDPKYARVGFMKELRRLNVAFTRCKKQLVIIGDIDYLKECLYMKPSEDMTDSLPCSADTDSTITAAQINQCAECPVEDCERKFARFMRLLMQHVESESDPAGNIIESDDLMTVLNGGNTH